MKVVLLQDVKKLGKRSEVVEVSDGYARNMLIKKGIAIEANNQNLNDLKLKLKNEEKKEENKRNEAKVLADKLLNKEITLQIKTGESGKTYGSITVKEISEAIKELFNIDIDKKNIIMDDNIKNVGEYNIVIKVYKDIETNINLKVESI